MTVGVMPAGQETTVLRVILCNYASTHRLVYCIFSSDALAAICNNPCTIHGDCVQPNQCSCNTGWGGPTCGAGKTSDSKVKE